VTAKKDSGRDSQLYNRLHAEIAGKTVTAEKYTRRDSSFRAETPCRNWREDRDSKEIHLQGLQLYSRNSMQRLQISQ
jgi:cell division protein FtsI/penicillin-binding protein 2